ncbi:MAG: arsenate reductase ArsC, partial [Ignavibacteria bacterium]|nr:arsenate reductase ArsC [Ignavibacteria bacterium]
MKKRILILCTGNSCRSQMAEGFLKSFDKNLEVYSAGTNPAEKINLKAVQVMKELGVDISSGVPKSVEKFIDQSFDYVITVCDHAKETCPVFIGEVKNQIHIG